MKLGLVAREFPPRIGGMPTLAVGLARALALECEVAVAVRQTDFAYREAFPIFPVLSGGIDEDLERLLDLNVDAWILLNCGYAPIAADMNAPCFVYCHGNDFLKPFIMRRRYLDLAGSLFNRRVTKPFVSFTRRVLAARDVREGLKHVRGAFVNSTNTANRLIAAHNVPRALVNVVHPGVDDDFFQNRVRRNDDFFQLLTVARLQRSNRRKNVDGTLRAVARLSDFPVRYTIVGDGDDRPRLEALSRQLGIDSKVSFTGAVDRAMLLQCYRESDLFVLVPSASRVDIEGFGIVYIEAAASGVPVLATSCSGQMDAIQEGVNGYLARSADPKAIEVAIRRAWKCRHTVSTSAMRKFAERFRWRRMGQQVISVIGRSLAQKDGTNPDTLLH